MITLLLLAGQANAIEAELSGSCPGAVRVEVTDATVSGMVMLLAGTDGYGSELVPDGPCSGVATGLAGLRAVGGLRPDTDLDGAHTYGLDLPGRRCAFAFQVLDIGTCTVSPVRSFTEPPVDLVGAELSYASESRSVHIWRSDSSAPLESYETFCEDRGLEWFEPLTAPDAQRVIDEAYALDSWHTWVITKAPIDGSASTLGGFFVTVDGTTDIVDSDGFTAIRKWSTSFCSPEDWGYTRCWDGDHGYDWLVCQDR